MCWDYFLFTDLDTIVSNPTGLIHLKWCCVRYLAAKSEADHYTREMKREQEEIINVPDTGMCCCSEIIDIFPFTYILPPNKESLLLFLNQRQQSVPRYCLSMDSGPLNTAPWLVPLERTHKPGWTSWWSELIFQTIKCLAQKFCILLLLSTGQLIQ